MDSYQEIESELKKLLKKSQELEVENSKLKEVIIDNDLQDEISNIDCSSTEENICINGIKHIASLVESHQYDKNDISNFQILFNTLRSIRGKKPADNKKIKSGEVKELLSIVDGKKNG